MASRAQGTETRARLVRAAIELFAEHGAGETSLNAVAAAAGVTRQGLLHYFPSKTDLLLAVLAQRDEDDAATVSADLDEAHDLAGALLVIMRHNQQQTGLTQLFAVAVAEGARPGHPTYEYFRERYGRARGRLKQAVELLQREGRITADIDADLLSAALLALMGGLNLQQLLEPELDHSEALAGMLRVLATG
jgi:AcrR family transcriptional regulator